jgi:quercetin dioxygenase-like cupin family protein
VSRKGQKHVFPCGKVARIGQLLPAVFLALSVLSVLAGVLFPAPTWPAPQPQAKKWADQMPEGEAKKLIVAKCQLCHTLERVVTAHHAKDDWEAVISLMVEQGASLTDDESKTVVDYLAANYPPQGAAAPAGAAPAAAAAESAPGMIIDPDQAQFRTAPDSLGLPKGVTMATVSGDPTKAGLFSVLFKLPADQMIPPHWQSSDVDAVVLRGTYEVGNGEAFDAGKLQAMNAGQLIHIPAQSHQFGHAKGATVILLYGMGPLSITWGP